MHVLEPKELEERRHSRDKQSKTKRRKRSILPLLCGLAVIYVLVALVVPLPALQARMTEPALPAAAVVDLPWPSYGQSAVGAVGYGLLAQSGDQKAAPIASVAKVITALAVLKVRPMQPGTQGETLTITKEDVATYKAYITQGQSVVAVTAGEQLTQYQAIQAMLLPSANNMADILVRWAFGSTDDYLSFVNPFVVTLGMAKTHIADASGFSPQTVSTAVDLAKLGEIAMNQPTLAEIVAQPQTSLPVAGVVYNVNSQLGNAGIVGIKTGNTDEAGGCYLVAATRNVDASHSVTVVSAVMGAPNREAAIAGTLPLLDETFKRFAVISPVATNQIVGTLTQKGGKQSPIVVKTAVPVVSWAGLMPRAEFAMRPLGAQVVAGNTVGTMTLQVGNMVTAMNLVATETLAPQSASWRLAHAAGRL